MAATLVNILDGVFALAENKQTVANCISFVTDKALMLDGSIQVTFH